MIKSATLVHINWQKQALDFLLALSPVKRSKDIQDIRYQTSQLLRKYAQADTVTLISLEDEITARVQYSTDVSINGFVEADSINSCIASNEIEIKEGKDFKWIGDDKLYVLPLNEHPYAGAFVLSYKQDVEEKEAFGEFLNAIWIGLKDITRLVQIYFSTERLTTRFRAILSTIPQSVIFVDDSGKEGWVNNSAAELLSIESGNVNAITLATAMHELRANAVNYEQLTAEASALFSSPGQKIKGWKWVYGTPTARVLSVSCVPAISTNISGRLWVFDDVTQAHIASEQLKELNEELAVKRQIADEQNMAKSDFLANMSHEIRTPMNGVIGMTSLLANTVLTEEQKDYVDTIRISGETLLSIINDILDFSKIESGKMELEKEPFNITKVIEETYDLLSVKAYEKGLDLLYYIDPGVPVEIIGDVTRFRQILVNLVGNGLKFTEQGEVLITASALEKNDDIYTLEFKVKDTGIGIPKDKYHRLFDSFSQVDSSTTRKYGGTGLGLAICQRIIRLMDGTITVESEENKGSCFTFTIKVPINKTAIRYNKQEKYSTDTFKEKSVLVLDDNLTNLHILQKHFHLWGLHTTIVDNYKDAMDALALNKYDLAILDMLMPEKDGVDVANLIREKGYNIPLVLFSSALHFTSHSKDEVNGLFTAVMNKPFKQEHVRDVLQRILGRAPKEEISAQKVPEEKNASTVSIEILVAEDDMINQKLIGRALQKLEYNYHIVGNGLKAVEALEEKRYDMVFMDVMMPVMDGIEATTIIKDKYGVHCPIVIALTANALAGDKEKLLNLGMDDFISKPYKIQDIQDVITKWSHKF